QRIGILGGSNPVIVVSVIIVEYMRQGGVPYPGISAFCAIKKVVMVRHAKVSDIFGVVVAVPQQAGMIVVVKVIPRYRNKIGFALDIQLPVRNRSESTVI